MGKSDQQLMPPPPLPSDSEIAQEKKDEAEANKRKLETPLAAMLPSKYAGVKVTDLFPDFRQDKVLRFSRLFGAGKPSSLPQIWRSIRKKRKRKRHKEGGGLHHDSESQSDDEKPRHKYKGWTWHFANDPAKEQCLSDDEEKLLKAVELGASDNKEEKNTRDDTGPKVADWRFGPAQVWYDMLEVPDTGEGFNYGFKIKEIVRFLNCITNHIFITNLLDFLEGRGRNRRRTLSR